MSFFTDFVIADPVDAKEIARTMEVDGTPLGEWSGFTVNAISVLDLAQLYGLLLGRPGVKDGGDLVDQFTPLYASQGWLTVQLIPPPFVDLLAVLPQEQFLSFAERWSEVEAFRQTTDPADLKELIAQLCELARQARAEGRAVLMCVSES